MSSALTEVRRPAAEPTVVRADRRKKPPSLRKARTFYLFVAPWIIGFVALCGRSLVHASADAKVVNFASNLAAVGVFSTSGYVVWQVAVPMAFGQLAGGVIGAKLAMRGGERIVRGVVLLVSGALIVKLVLDLI